MCEHFGLKKNKKLCKGQSTLPACISSKPPPPPLVGMNGGPFLCFFHLERKRETESTRVVWTNGRVFPSGWKPDGFYVTLYCIIYIFLCFVGRYNMRFLIKNKENVYLSPVFFMCHGM